jgi:hypothetical protein
MKEPLLLNPAPPEIVERMRTEEFNAGIGALYKAIDIITEVMTVVNETFSKIEPLLAELKACDDWMEAHNQQPYKLYPFTDSQSLNLWIGVMRDYYNPN